MGSNMDVDKNTKDKHHVHFDEPTDSFDHDSNIWLSPTSNGYNVHLGFLQINHWYHIQFSFSAPKSLNKLFHTEEQVKTNFNLIELSLSEEKDDKNIYQMKFELFAYKEKLLKEKVVLKSCDNPSQTFTLILNARVLGKGKGTPLLRNGIQCIEVKNDEDESDFSDWQGFDRAI